MKSGTTSLLPKQMVPDYGKSQHENHSHSKTRLLDYHDSAHIGCNAVSQVTVSDQRFWNVLSEFPSVTKDIHFNQPCKHPFEHHILTKGRPCFARARKVAPKYANLARQKINEMLANGVLERAPGPYASPMHLVPKDGGKDIRIVGDYRALNMSIVKDTYQIPRILEFQNKMKDAKSFQL